MLRSVVGGVIGMVIATSSVPAQEVAKDSWHVPAERECESVRVGWSVPADSLGVLPYRSNAQQVQRHGSARVLISLQAFTCPQSVVDEEPTGSFTVASIKIPIFPNPDTPDALLPDHHSSVDKWTYVDTYIAPENSPIGPLLGRYGFEPWVADVEMDVRESRMDTLHASLTIESDAGRIQIDARATEETETSDRSRSVLITEQAVVANSASGLVHGEGQARMTVDGSTPLKGLTPPTATFEFVTIETHHSFQRVLRSRSR